MRRPRPNTRYGGAFPLFDICECTPPSTRHTAVAQAKEGDEVQVHYTGKLEDGTVFDTSQDGEPLSFTIGENRVIPGFETAVVGMEPGDSKTTEIDPEQACGEHRDDMVMELD